MMIWSSSDGPVQKVENVGKAPNSYTSLDGPYGRRSEEHRAHAGILRPDDIPPRIVPNKDRVRRRDVYQFRRASKRSRVGLPPAHVSAENRRINSSRSP